MSYGKALKTIRLIKGLLQEDVASKAHVDVRTLREIESERRHLSADEVQKFSEIYKIDVKLIYEMAQDQVPLQNIVYEAKRDGIVVNNGQGIDNPYSLEYLLTKYKELENRVAELEKKMNRA